MKRLHSLETKEVSIVPKGANKKKWLILKSDKKSPMSKEDLDKIVSCEPDMMEKVDGVLKDYGDLNTGFADEEGDIGEGIEKNPFTDEDMGDMLQKAMGTEPQPGDVSDQDRQFDERMKTSLKAAVRILNPHKETLNRSGDLLAKVLDAAGLNVSAGEPDGGDEMATKQGSSRMSPEPVKEEHKIEAMKVAKEAGMKAYKEHMSKLGYQKYPTEEIAQKDVNHDPDEPAQDDEQSGNEHNPDKGDHMAKSVTKSLELSKLPKDVRPAVTEIFKAHAELVEKNESLTKEVEGLRHRELRREFVQKAEGMKHLGIEQDTLVETLIALSRKAPEEFAKIEKALLKGSELVEKSALFEELGSSLPGALGVDDKSGLDWAAMQKAAEGWVQKSGKVMSKEAAFDAFTQTDEGRKMYNQYLSNHASSGRK